MNSLLFIYNTTYKMFAVLLCIFAIGVSVYLVILKRSSSKFQNYPPGPLNLPFVAGTYVLGAEPQIKLIELKRKYGKVIALNFGSYRTGKINEEQRAFMLKALRNFGVGTKKMDVLLQEQLKIVYGSFDEQDGKVIVNVDLFNTLAIGALWTIISGEAGKADDANFNYILVTTRKTAAACGPVVLYFPKLAQTFPNISGWNGLVQSISEQNVYVTKSIESHKEFLKDEDEEPRDIIEAYLQKIRSTHDTTSTFYGTEGARNIIATTSDLLLAGTETISTVTTWLLTILIRHPDIQNKIQDDIDKIIGPNRLSSLTDRPLLPYIKAFIFEILRYSAMVPLGVPHETTVEVEISGYTIPKNTIVITNFYDILHDPFIWDEPEQFMPERFLNEDGSEILRELTSKIDLAFGYGKRLCPGIALAKDELFLFITGLCQRYTFLKDPKSHYSSKIKVKVGQVLYHSHII